MSATTFPWNEADCYVRAGIMVDPTLFIQQLIVWEMTEAFGPETDGVITHLLASLDPENADHGTRYGWIITEDKEFVVMRNHEMHRFPPHKYQ